MTKARDPVTIENTLYQVLGKIRIERAAEVTGRERDYLRSLSDPGSRYRLTIEDAIKLDLEYAANGGAGMPLYETYGLLLDMARAERFSGADAIARAAIKVIKEGGDAHSALVTASLPGASEADRLAAAKECEEARLSLADALPLLIGAGQPP